MKQHTIINADSEYQERRRCTCQFCGEYVEPGDRVEASAPAQPKLIAHRDCCRKRNYSFKPPIWEHKGKIKDGSTVQWSAEVEIMHETTPEERLEAHFILGSYCTSDSTVTEEHKTAIFRGLHGLRDYCETIERVLHPESETTERRNGTHLNISLAGWSDPQDQQGQASFLEVRTNAVRDLMTYFEELTPSQRERLIGRDFCYYAANRRDGHHGDAVNTDHMFGSNPRLEIRLCKFTTAAQYARMIYFFTEYLKIGYKNALDIYGGQRRADRQRRRLWDQFVSGSMPFDLRGRSATGKQDGRRAR